MTPTEDTALAPPPDTDAGPVSPPTRPSGFLYSPMFPLGRTRPPWRKLPSDGVSTLEVEGKTVLKVEPEALKQLAFQAFKDVSHLLRPAHLPAAARRSSRTRRPAPTTASSRSTC